MQLRELIAKVGLSKFRKYCFAIGFIILGLAALCGSPSLLVWEAIFLEYCISNAVIPLAPTLTQDYVLLSALTSCKYVVSVIIAPVASTLLDNKEVKAVKIGLLIGTISTLGTALVTNYYAWLGWRSVAGFSQAGVVWGGYALLNRLHTDEAPRASAMYMAAFSIYLGCITGPQLGTAFMDEPCSNLFLALGGLQSCVLVMIVWRLPQLPEGSEDPQLAKTKFTTLDLLRDVQLKHCIGVALLTNCLWDALESIMEEHMMKLNYTDAQVSIAWALFTVPSLAVFMILPLLQGIRWWGKGQVAQIASMCIAGVASAVYGSIAGFEADYAWFLVLLTLATVTTAVSDGTMPVILSDISLKRFNKTSQVYIISNLSDQLANLLGPAAGSVLCKYLGVRSMCLAFGTCMPVYATFVCYSSRKWHRSAESDVPVP